MTHKDAVTLLECTPSQKGLSPRKKIRPLVRIDPRGTKGKRDARRHRTVGMLMRVVNEEFAIVKPDKHGKEEQIALRFLSNWKCRNVKNGIVIPDDNGEESAGDTMIRPRIKDEPADKSRNGTAEHGSETFVLRHTETGKFWDNHGWIDDPEKARQFIKQRFAKTTRTTMMNRDSSITEEKVEVLTMDQAVEKFCTTPPAPMPSPDLIDRPLQLFAGDASTTDAVRRARSNLNEAERLYQAAKDELRRVLEAHRQACLEQARVIEQEIEAVAVAI